MEIPFVNLKAQYLSIQKEINSTVLSTLGSAQFIQGPEVSLFEQEFAEYVGVDHCIGVNSGTDALILGIRALDLQPGDEVIVPANTFIATALGVSENGLKPVFCDINPADHGINLEDLARKITTRTKAVIVVHLYGQSDNIDEIKKVIKKSGKSIYLIEDACQAHGAYFKNKRVGGFGVFSAFSFYPGKNLGAYGDGGALLTDRPALAKKMRMLREYGQKKKYFHESLGTNSRLDTLQAAILRVKLAHLDSWNAQRQEIARWYTEALHTKVPQALTPSSLPHRHSVFHLYVIQAPQRDALQAYLMSHGIHALIHYPIPLHLQKAYRYLGYKKGELPMAEHMAKHIISLPIFPELRTEQVSYVVQKIQDFYKS